MAIKFAGPIISLCILLSALVGFSLGQTEKGFYDTNSQTCCNGKVYNTATDKSLSYYCCGSRLYNLTTEQQASSYYYCCGSKLIDSNKQICCGSTSYNIKTDKNNYCCGENYITLSNNQICCNGKAVSVTAADGYTFYDYQCCGSKPYLTDTDVCCNDNIIKNVGDNLYCCGNNTYNYNTEICCYDTGKVLKKPQSSCNGSTFTYYSCCNDRLIGGNQQCCNNVVVNPSITSVTYDYGTYDQYSYCCGMGMVQNPNKEVCCGDGSVITGGYSMGCCGSTAYNYTTQLCCGSSLYSIGTPPDTGSSGYYSTLSCCGDTIYDYNRQSCCNGKVGPSGLSCCYSYSS